MRVYSCSKPNQKSSSSSSMVARPFGRTHAWIEGAGSQQLFEYGFGLSYATMRYSGLTVRARGGGSGPPHLDVEFGLASTVHRSDDMREMNRSFVELLEWMVRSTTANGIPRT